MTGAAVANRSGRGVAGRLEKVSRNVPWRAQADGVDVALRVSTGASRDLIDGVASGPDGEVVLRVRVAARAEGGKANDAVIKLLSRSWRVPKTSVSIVSGGTDRRKRLYTAGDPTDLLDRLEYWLKAR